MTDARNFFADVPVSMFRLIIGKSLFVSVRLPPRRLEENSAYSVTLMPIAL
jgi:hypothetical protein